MREHADALVDRFSERKDSGEANRNTAVMAKGKSQSYPKVALSVDADQ